MIFKHARSDHVPEFWKVPSSTILTQVNVFGSTEKYFDCVGFQELVT